MQHRSSFSAFSITKKMLTFYIFIITICISTMVSIISVYSTRSINEIAEASAKQIMLSSYRSITAQINDINYIFTTLQANNDLQNILMDYSADNTLEDINCLENILFSIDIYEKKFNNIELYALNHPEYKNYHSEHIFSSDRIANFSFYNEILSLDPEPHWQSNDNNYSTNSHVSVIKVITNCYSHQPIAIVRILINTSQFIETIHNIKIANTGRLFICTSEGHILNPHNDSFIGMFTNSSVLHDLIQIGSSSTVYSKINSQNHIVSIYPLDDTGFYLVGAAPTNEFNTKAHSLIIAIIFTSITMTIIILLLLNYVSLYISKPIISLSKQMETFTIDNPQFMSHTQHDEIAVLYDSFNNMQKRIIKLTTDLKKSISFQRKAELKAIQAQVSPHFLYNALNSISVLAQKHNIDEIEYLTSSLATFFTRTLNNGNTFCTVRDELTHIKSYMNIQNIRFANKFEVIIDISEPALSCPIINLTLQPLIENCIIHAFRNKPDKGIIRIGSKIQDDDLYITVADNGLGSNIVDAANLNEYLNKPFTPDGEISHCGIHNVNYRIKLYYGEKYGLSYSENEYGGFTATVHICTERIIDNSNKGESK